MGVPYAEVIGDPIAHSKSPLIHKFWLEKLGLGYDFRLTHVRPGEVADYLETRRLDPDWCGCSVTIPHKQAVIGRLDRLVPEAASIGAVNCVTREGRVDPLLIGDNTDWIGFLEPLRPWLNEEHEFRLAYVLGTGGAAAAVSYALDKSGFTIVTVGRDHGKELALRHRLRLFDDDLCDDLHRMGELAPMEWGDRTNVLDMLVNATPLGMEGFPVLDLNLLARPRETIVYDLVYHPLETPLLHRARELGMPTIDGLAMLIGQAAVAFERFFAEKPPREHDAELRELLTK
jgi:shikimate dehydrogenase